ncbi:hypothetical protein ET475_09125 [Microbacterium protaetiae]|uniref:Uncharacterized protein n=1 Tax=Microbacterium protaetiae TaxID=2509458 RepID=A0A4P6ED16_9MICO|nr:hypothetical protein [Microbacterium protaetiae]QAY60135.1 hypothetical protein ET475_09125 [Microbacterium protaetiae]
MTPATGIDRAHTGAVSVDDAFRAYAAERLTGAQWFPVTRNADASSTTIRQSDTGLVELVDTDERGAEYPKSTTWFADESLALLGLLARRRMAESDAPTSAETDRFMQSADVPALAIEQPQVVLDLPVLVPYDDPTAFTIHLDDDRRVTVATGWQGLERAGRADVPRTILPLSALVSAGDVYGIRVFTRHGEIEVDSSSLARLRAHASDQGSVLSFGPAHVGTQGSRDERTAAMRTLPTRQGLDWFPRTGVMRTDDRAGIARQGDAWVAWPASSAPSVTVHATESSALAALIAYTER